MRAMLPTAGEAANNPTVQSESESRELVRAVPIETPTVQTDSEDHSWFSNPAQVLLGSDPGFALHILTGKIISESSGYRYASGERGVPGFILRTLLHSRQGEPWLAAIMDGCTEPWWLEHQRHARMGAAADNAK